MIDVALSPCPNDTFLFAPWIEGFVESKYPITPHFADIQTLNKWAFSKRFPLIKISVAVFPKLLPFYQLLPVGAALGFGCGPKLIGKKPYTLADLPNLTVAIPGEDITAHTLLSHFAPSPKEKHFCLYHEIFPLLNSDEVDCGLIIHESRFTYSEAGFFEIADLGELWEKKTSLPLPLGALAIQKSLPEPQKKGLTRALQDSLLYSKSHPEKSLPLILKHAQELSPEIVQKHIETYVTKETEILSEEGKKAIETLLSCPLPPDWVYSPS
ncbi:MAG: 1,4-dihydroxy-6-naphtoate synthase [Chlamydiae bacterium]|nr:1,4-dihydroxy-6-naphtoate synthase [Chlamydiota bacterium]